MHCALDLIANIDEGTEGVSFDVHTATGVQRWRYAPDQNAGPHREADRDPRQVAAPTHLDRQWCWSSCWIAKSMRPV